MLSEDFMTLLVNLFLNCHLLFKYSIDVCTQLRCNFLLFDKSSLRKFLHLIWNVIARVTFSETVSILVYRQRQFNLFLRLDVQNHEGLFQRCESLNDNFFDICHMSHEMIQTTIVQNSNKT